jgi:carbamoylphosphate synthase small subunit
VVSQLGNEAVLNIDTTKLARKILRDGDMSPEVLRSENDVNEMKENMLQQQQLAQAAQQVIQQQTEN